MIGRRGYMIKATFLLLGILILVDVVGASTLTHSVANSVANSVTEKDYPMLVDDYKKALRWGIFPTEIFAPEKNVLVDNIKTKMQNKSRRAWLDALMDVIQEDGLTGHYLQTIEFLKPNLNSTERLRIMSLQFGLEDKKNNSLLFFDEEYFKSLEERISVMTHRKSVGTGSFESDFFPELMTREELFLLSELLGQYNFSNIPQVLGLKNNLELLFPGVSETLDKSKQTKGLSEKQLKTLFGYKPDLQNFMGGQYKEGVQLFVICHKNRDWPCSLVIRGNDGEFFRDENGNIWIGAALASSSRGFFSHQRNGQTPMGVQRMDGVMPRANAQDSFGRFRRVILNWIPQIYDPAIEALGLDSDLSANDKNFKLLEDYKAQEVESLKLLPPEFVEKNWWLQAPVARDAGRVDLRIHGTGRPTTDPTVPWFPFRKTAGCVAQREYVESDYSFLDQRLLLDNLMKAQGLIPNYENEVNIKGLLFLVENEGDKPLTQEQLKNLL